MKKGNLVLIYWAGFVTSFLMAIFLNSFINYVPRPTFFDGAAMGLFTAVTFAVPLIISNSLFQRLGIKNALINSGYWLLTIVIMGGILAAWH